MPGPASHGQKRLAGKIAVVTGAGAGIGQGCALMFAAQGATVIALDIDQAALDATRASAPGTMTTLAANLMDEHATDAAIAQIAAQHGRIDILVNAAAISHFNTIDRMTTTEWRQTLAGELDIVFFITRAAWPHLKVGGRSAIVNFASANAHVALDGSPALAHCAGKGGVLAMTRQLAMEGGPHGIRANTISPGLIVTQQTARHMASDLAFHDRVMAKTMIKRLGQPEDIAWCATWLASDEAAYVTGADISVDGGATAW